MADPKMQPDFAPWQGSNGAEDCPIQDNGTQGRNFSVGGVSSVSKVDYPLPPDVNAPPGPDAESRNDAEVSDIGLNESVEVGYNGSIAEYGFGGSVGGHTNTNTKD